MENEQPNESPWYQFQVKRNHIEIRGGITTESIGIMATVRKSFYYYGLVAFEFQIGPLFLFVEIFREKE